MDRLSGTAAAVAVLVAGGFALSSMVVLGPATDQRSVENPYPISQGGPGPTPTATKTITATAPAPRKTPGAKATTPKASAPTTRPTTSTALRASPTLPTTAPATTAPATSAAPTTAPTTAPDAPPSQEREEPLGPPVPPLEPVDLPPEVEAPAPDPATTLIVGVDIAPGPHTAPGGPTCLWQRLVTDDVGGALVVAEGGGQGEQMVDVAASDTALRSVGCGQWLPAPPPESAPEGEAAPLPSPDGP